MEFDREFFLDEVRDGFFVPSMMKKAWASGIENYEKLRAICKKHDIPLYASWGTLIAAIRHGGYIPWDDDLDVMILREDLEKLEKALETEPDIGEYHIQDYHATHGNNMIRQWVEKSVYIYGPDEWERRHGFPFGDVIDIFVLDHIPEDMGERLHQAEAIGACNRLQLLAGEVYGDSSKRDKSKENSEFKKALKEAEKLLGKTIVFSGEDPIRVQVLAEMDRYIASYAKGHKDAGVADIPNYLGNKDRLLPAEYLDSVIEVPYEGGTIGVPVAYDSILRRYYGEYMTPQIAVDYGHDYPVYEKYSDTLKERFGFELLRYKFDQRAYEDVLSKKEESIPLAESIKATGGLLHEAHEYIISGLKSDGDVQEIIELLGQCQTLAISLGSKIEVRTAEHEETISVLERYCESIYEVYGKLAAGGSAEKADTDMLTSAFGECEQLMEDLSKEASNEQKEILFVCDRAKHWEALHAIWGERSKKENTHVSVIALPFKYKDATWLVTEGEWEADVSGYPDEVKLTPYEGYDIAAIHPDEIIYTFPYDVYSDVIAPHPMFYTENMRLYADRMTFIPPFELREIVSGDNRSRYTLNTFIANPGAVYADMIIVQSEGMKSIYEELLSDMTDVIDWSDRVRVRDKSGDSGKTDGTGEKKRMLIYFSGSMLYEHAEAIDKIKVVIDLLETHKSDIIPIWVTDPYAEQILKDRRPDTWREYEDIVAGLKASDIWQVDEGTDTDSLAEICDGMYGDAGVLMNTCRMLKKPVMWEAPDVPVEV